jgi:succinate dehydrogenase/fumarate reductase iron-sulfur protein
MASGETPDPIRARIFRFDPDTDREPRYETYEVPWTPRMRVLEVLDYVNETLAQDVAYRWFCGVKRCGTCAVSVNGSPALACWEPAQAEMTIEPLRSLPVVRDLVTEREPYEALLRRMGPLLVRREPYRSFPESLSHTGMAPSAHLRDCIQCLACYAACPVVEQPDSGFAGPAPLVALAELALDPRDGLDRAKLAAEDAQVFKCVSCYECERVCPAGIPIVGEAIEPLKRRAFARGAGAGAHHAQVFLDVVKAYGRVNAPRLVLGSKGLSGEVLRTGLRMVARGKVKPLQMLLGRPSDGAETIRKLYESTEKDG